MSKPIIAFGIGSILAAALLTFLKPGGNAAGVCGLIGLVLLFYGIIGKDEDSENTTFFQRLRQINKETTTPAVAVPTPLKPSFLFIFGAPLGDNRSDQWVMMLRHFGPASAHNCQIVLYDKDRKNIEHQWLTAHPNCPYPPPNLAGQSQHSVHIPEASREGSAGFFLWKPLDPDSQHYSVSISCRDGVFAEEWEITRVNGILRSKIKIKHGPQWMKDNSGQNPTVFQYEDPEFVQAPIATEVPKQNGAKKVHPGWKPNHRIEVPMAIIDPNNNVQVASGIKQPDGSTRTDFGSWNILTHHYGD